MLVYISNISGDELTDLLTPDQPAAAFDEEVYDDVDSQVLPPPPPLSRSATLGLFGSLLAAGLIDNGALFCCFVVFVLQPSGIQAHEQGCGDGPEEAEEDGERGEGVQEKV